jgi:hypothetical protein
MMPPKHVLSRCVCDLASPCIVPLAQLMSLVPWSLVEVRERLG